MSFATFEESRSRGEPVNLYYFKYGQAVESFFAYTDAEVPVVHAGIPYEPMPIDRNSINSSGTLDKSTLTVTMPKSARLSEIFRVYPPSQVVTLHVRQGHLGDPSNEFLVVWAGRVLGRDVQIDEVVFTCEPIATSVQRAGLRRNYQFGCPHVLYGNQCLASKIAASISAIVVTVSGDTVTLPDGWNGSRATEKYIGGMVQWTAGGENELRTILRITSDKVLRLSGVARGMVAGQTVTVILGCDRQLGDCETLHNNVQNFGGQPWIPIKNPFAKLSPFV